MYLYVNDEHDLVGFMPSARGRIAANHSVSDIYGIEVSVSVVPQTAVDNPKASARWLKAWVVENGSTQAANLVAPGVVLMSLLRVANDVLTDSTWTKQREVVQQLIAEGESRPENFDAWAANAASAINGVRRTLNAIMNERKAGWFIRANVVESAETPETTTEAASTEYGFARMSGDRPTLGVVGADDDADADGEHGVFYPKPDATYIINNKIENLFNILEASSKKCPQNVNLIGPHGCGKTELAIQFAARQKRPLLIMDCANLREARDWFGYKTAREGTVYWHESQFVRAVQAGNHVILLDELNRANPNLLNTLMPILDARRFTYLEEKGDKIVVGPGTVFFASMNEGAGYTGTSALDRAIRDRFPRAVELTYLGEADETRLLVNRCGVSKDIATRLVQMANKIRQEATGLSAALTESLSTRQLIAAAHDFLLGGVDTLQFTITNHFSPEGDEESERVRVQSIIQGKFGDLIAAAAAAGTAAVGA